MGNIWIERDREIEVTWELLRFRDREMEVTWETFRERERERERGGNDVGNIWRARRIETYNVTFCAFSLSVLMGGTRGGNGNKKCL